MSPRRKERRKISQTDGADVDGEMFTSTGILNIHKGSASIPDQSNDTTSTNRLALSPDSQPPLLLPNGEKWKRALLISLKLGTNSEVPQD